MHGCAHLPRLLGTHHGAGFVACRLRLRVALMCYTRLQLLELGWWHVPPGGPGELRAGTMGSHRGASAVTNRFPHKEPSGAALFQPTFANPNWIAYVIQLGLAKVG